MIFVVAVVDAAVAVGVVAVVVDTVVAVDDAIVVDAAAVDVNDDDESYAFVSMQFERSFGWAYFEKLQAHA